MNEVFNDATDHLEKGRTYYSSQIRTRWNKAFDSVLEVGRLLEEAAKAMPKNQYRAFMKKDLPFSYSVAQRLRKISKNPRINDPKNRQFMPFSWNTLVSIANLSDETFQQGIDDGIITSACEYKAIKKLRDAELSAESRQKMDQVIARQATVNTAPQSSGLTLVPQPTKKRSRTSELAALREQAEDKMCGPKPLLLSISSDIVKTYGTELAALVEDLNHTLPEKYNFISEVRLKAA